MRRIFYLNSKDVKSFKDFVGIGKAENVHFYVRPSNVFVVLEVEGLFVLNKMFEIVTDLYEDLEIDFILRRDVVLQALSVFESGIDWFDDGGTIKLSCKGNAVNVYKVAGVQNEGESFIEVKGERREITPTRAKFIYDGFNLQNVAGSYMMGGISLGATSSYQGKMHYVELDTPEFKNEREVLVGHSFTGILKSYTSLCGEGEKCFVSFDSREESYMLLSIMKGVVVTAQVRAEMIYEKKLWEVESLLKDKQFSFKLFDRLDDDMSLTELFDIFSIPLMGRGDKELECEYEEGQSKLNFVVYDVGNQPTKISLKVEEVEGGMEGAPKLVYQSLVDIFSRKLGEYQVEGYENVWEIKTEKTRDIVVKMI